MARIERAEVDPVVSANFTIEPSDKVVTAGSCFAQHIARRLAGSGFDFYVTEAAHPLVDKTMAEDFGYGVFSARYGNIYTTRQLLQLLRRASGTFNPQDDIWEDHKGRLFDPFRPAIHPGGYLSAQELLADRQQHYLAVMRAFRDMDVFVFTLGLTECWANKSDGAVFPICPGVMAGSFDPALHVLLNLSVDEVVRDFMEFHNLISEFNPKVKYLLTVSPVPLMATAENRHVLVSTTYSKSVLRVAAQIIEQQIKNPAAYFPSYEIITGSHARGQYYADDLRSITEEGVDHVMRLFFKHYAPSGQLGLVDPQTPNENRHTEEMLRLVKVQCEEEVLADAGNPQT